MYRKHEGLDLAGIIVSYVLGAVSGLTLLIEGIVLIVWEEYIGFMLIFYSLFSFFVVLLTIFYHTNRIRNHILIGVLNVISNLIGGIFILVGQPKKKQPSQYRNTQTSIELKLRQLESLYNDDLITKEEYDRKREAILEDF